MNKMLSISLVLTLATSALPFAAAVIEYGECEPGPIVPWTMCMTQEVRGEAGYVVGQGAYLVNWVCETLVTGRPCLKDIAITTASGVSLLP